MVGEDCISRRPRIIVDGVDYAPATEHLPSVGVAITTRNRPDTLADTLKAFNEHSPHIPIVVIDDGSTEPVTVDATVIRHETSQGIPAAKNRCIAELMKIGVEHLFLFDDDTKPARPDWWRPYVDSPEPHLQHSWTHFSTGRAVDKMSVLHTTPQTIAYAWSMGCMLYTHRDVINRVGGMRECFAPAMHEHIEWSLRIHNAGLTTWPHQDIPGSADLIDAADRYQTVKSSINLDDRQKQLHRNNELLQTHKQSSDYVPYGTEDVVLSCLFTSQPDPQRGTVMQPNPALAATLLKSLAGINTTVLCDFPTEEPQFERVHGGLSPYIQRWVAYREWLTRHPEVRYVWCVDATDVENLRNPFPDMQPSTLYCGWENQVVGCQWMLNNHDASRPWIEANTNRPLLNAGVAGGDRKTILELCSRIITLWSQSKPVDKAGDMGYFNQAAHEMHPVTGPHITTLFKGNERNDFSLWKHK